MNTVRNKKIGMIYLISIIPFLLNDLSNIFFVSYERWLMVDYFCRLVSLSFIGICVGRGLLSLEDIGLSVCRKDRQVYWTLFLAVLCLAYFATSKLFLKPYLTTVSLDSITLDRQSVLYDFDLYLGLALVAISEEVVGRGVAYSALRQFTDNNVVIVIISSIVFAAFHWSLGPLSMVDCFVYGVLFMAVTIRTNSVLPAIVVHYFLDYVYYA